MKYSNEVIEAYDTLEKLYGVGKLTSDKADLNEVVLRTLVNKGLVEREEYYMGYGVTATEKGQIIIQNMDKEKAFKKLKSLFKKPVKTSDKIEVVVNNKVSQYDYEIYPEGIRDINEYRKVIKLNFPDLVELSEVTASVIFTLLLKDNSNPASLIIEGAPSGQKTTVLSFFDNITNITLNVDDFSPKSFVSHYVAQKQIDLSENDLLPKIRHKSMLVKELAPIFNKRKEDVLENIGILTKVFDGEGYVKSSGAQGLRGYQGDYLFSFLGATTPLPSSTWNIMGKLGSRFLFYSVNNKKMGKKEARYNIFNTKNSYKKRLTNCRKATRELVSNLFDEYGGVRSVEWDSTKDSEELLDRLYDYANLIIHLRAPISIWAEKGVSGEKSYEFKTPIIEDIPRVASLLFNLARGHALLCGRRNLEQEDIDIIRKVALSSMPYDRRKLLRILIKLNGKLTISDLGKHMNASDSTARRTKETVKVLGLVDEVETVLPNGGMETVLVMKKEFRWILKSNRHENAGVSKEKNILTHTGENVNVRYPEVSS